jgi:hypothetical protein
MSTDDYEVYPKRPVRPVNATVNCRNRCFTWVPLLNKRNEYTKLEVIMKSVDNCASMLTPRGGVSMILEPEMVTMRMYWHNLWSEGSLSTARLLGESLRGHKVKVNAEQAGFGASVANDLLAQVRVQFPS